MESKGRAISSRIKTEYINIDSPPAPGPHSGPLAVRVAAAREGCFSNTASSGARRECQLISEVQNFATLPFLMSIFYIKMFN